MFSIHIIAPSKNTYKNMILKLFDTLVTPLLTYGSSVWGPTLVKVSSGNFKKICDSAIYEKKNMWNFESIYWALGNIQSMMPFLGELGRYPVVIKLLSNGRKLFQRFQNLHDSTPVMSSHQDVIQWPQFFYKTSCLRKRAHCIKRFICTFNNSATKPHPTMKLDYKQAWLKIFHNDGKLRSYAVVKRDFFLWKISSLREYCQSEKILTGLRISSAETASSINPLLKTVYVQCVIRG